MKAVEPFDVTLEKAGWVEDAKQVRLTILMKELRARLWK